jgi:hypothetical protein
MVRACHLKILPAGRVVALGDAEERNEAKVATQQLVFLGLAQGLHHHLVHEHRRVRQRGRNLCPRINRSTARWTARGGERAWLTQSSADGWLAVYSSPSLNGPSVSGMWPLTPLCSRRTCQPQMCFAHSTGTCAMHGCCCCCFADRARRADDLLRVAEHHGEQVLKRFVEPLLHRVAQRGMGLHCNLRAKSRRGRCARGERRSRKGGRARERTAT